MFIIRTIFFSIETLAAIYQRVAFFKICKLLKVKSLQVSKINTPRCI